MRIQQSILFGSTDFRVNNTVFAFSRIKKGNPGYLVAVNFGDTEVNADVSGLPNLPKEGTVHVRSFHAKKEGDTVTDGEPGDEEAVG